MCSGARWPTIASAACTQCYAWCVREPRARATDPNRAPASHESALLRTSDLKPGGRFMTDTGTTRATFLARGAKGGLALVAGGSALALTDGVALGAASADATIAKLAA